jgi:hypothetical protein
LKKLGASYYDGSACHLDLVQWATDPVWGQLPPPEKAKLIDADLCFLDRQLSREKIRILLLNGSGIVKGYSERLGVKLMEHSSLAFGRVRFLAGSDSRGLIVIGWNINLRTNRASNLEMETIGETVRKTATQMKDMRIGGALI